MRYTVDTFPGRTIAINGKTQLYFGGTSYLGLQTDLAFQDIVIQNLKALGTNYGASRKANVRYSIFERAEQHLADWVGSERCLSMSSGYLAGQLVVQALCTSEHKFFYAPDCHSALRLPNEAPFRNYKALKTAVLEHLNSENSIPVVFMDSIDLHGCCYPQFKVLRDLPLEKIILVIDDSHGIGIVGDDGGGTFRKAKELNTKELVVSCSLGKGFGIQAGAIFGSIDRIAQLEKTDFFGGASPAAPAGLAALIEARPIIDAKRFRLQDNIALFLNTLKRPDQLRYLENYPAFYSTNPEMVPFLEKNNIVITSFNYPNEDSPLVSRIVLSANHKKEDILLLAELLNTQVE